AISTSLSDELGELEDFTFKAGQEEGRGTLNVNFDGVEANIPVSIGTTRQPFEGFEQFNQPLKYNALPQQIAKNGSFRLTESGEPVFQGEKALRLQYNFTDAPQSETRFAYGVLGETP